MVDSGYGPDIYKSSKIRIGELIKFVNICS